MLEYKKMQRAAEEARKQQEMEAQRMKQAARNAEQRAEYAARKKIQQLKLDEEKKVCGAFASYGIPMGSCAQRQQMGDVVHARDASAGDAARHEACMHGRMGLARSHNLRERGWCRSRVWRVLASYGASLGLCAPQYTGLAPLRYRLCPLVYVLVCMTPSSYKNLFLGLDSSLSHRPP